MSIKISINNLHKIDRIGEFNLLNPVHNFTYRNPTNTIHLYNYSGLIRINSKEYEFNPGDITCIQSGNLYSYSTKTPGRHWCVHFYDIPDDKCQTIGIPEFIPTGVNSLFFLEQIKHISTLHNSLGTNDATELMNLEARHRLKALLISIFIMANGQHKQARSRNNFVWETLLTWIDENISEPISTASLAKKVNITPNTLSQKFKKQYNTTISQYILHKRIDKAKSLLTTTCLTIYEIGASVGIKDPQYFNKQFHKIAGISPSRYRDQNQEYLSTTTPQLATLGGQWKSTTLD